MKSSPYEIGDVLIINHNGVEQIARLADYEDQLDDTKPLYVNLRISDGQAWGKRKVKIQSAWIKGVDKDWYARREAAHKAALKKSADEAYAKMSPEQKQQIHKQYQKLFGTPSLSPIERLIDQACGLE